MPRMMRRTYFEEQHRIEIDEAKCVGCQICMKHCPVKHALAYNEETNKVFVDQAAYCIGCLACLDRCPADAVTIVPL